MHVYLSTSLTGDVFSGKRTPSRQNHDEDLPKFVWENITFGDWNDARVVHYDVQLPEVSSCVCWSWNRKVELEVSSYDGMVHYGQTYSS